MADLTVEGADDRFVDDAASVDGVAAVETRRSADLPMEIGELSFLGRVIGYPLGGELNRNRHRIDDGRDSIATTRRRSCSTATRQPTSEPRSATPSPSQADRPRSSASPPPPEYLWPARDRQSLFTPTEVVRRGVRIRGPAGRRRGAGRGRRGADPLRRRRRRRRARHRAGGSGARRGRSRRAAVGDPAVERGGHRGDGGAAHHGAGPPAAVPRGRGDGDLRGRHPPGGHPARGDRHPAGLGVHPPHDERALPRLRAECRAGGAPPSARCSAASSPGPSPPSTPRSSGSPTWSPSSTCPRC